MQKLIPLLALLILPQYCMSQVSFDEAQRRLEAKKAAATQPAAQESEAMRLRKQVAELHREIAELKAIIAALKERQVTVMYQGQDDARRPTVGQDFAALARASKGGFIKTGETTQGTCYRYAAEAGDKDNGMLVVVDRGGKIIAIEYPQ